MYLAVIFDMDGVIIDTELWGLQATANLLAEYGVYRSREELLGLVGASGSAYRNTMAGFLHVSCEEYVSMKSAYYQRNPIPYKQLMVPGVVELLEWVQSDGYSMGLVTSDTLPATELKLQETGLKDFFPVVITSEVVTYSKPNPEAYLLAARMLNVKPEKCLVLEDSAYGVAAAHAAGMTVVARRNPEIPQDIALAKHQISSLLELKSILMSAAEGGA